MRKQIIYFVQGVDGGPIKIGKTMDNMWVRFQALQCGSPIILKVLGIIDDESFTEKELHIRFSQYRSHNEWFHPENELIDFINNYTIECDLRPPSKTKEYIDYDESAHITKQFWTQDEIDLVSKHYNYKDLDLLMELMPHRTRKSISHVASKLGLQLKPKSSKYKGVYWHKKQKKWTSVLVCTNNKRINLGSFDDEESARLAYEEYIQLNKL